MCDEFESQIKIKRLEGGIYLLATHSIKSKNHGNGGYKKCCPYSTARLKERKLPHFGRIVLAQVELLGKQEEEKRRAPK